MDGPGNGWFTPSGLLPATNTGHARTWPSPAQEGKALWPSPHAPGRPAAGGAATCVSMPADELVFVTRLLAFIGGFAFTFASAIVNEDPVGFKHRVARSEGLINTS
jgi:hypothetical protein